MTVKTSLSFGAVEIASEQIESFYQPFAVGLTASSTPTTRYLRLTATLIITLFLATMIFSLLSAAQSTGKVSPNNPPPAGLAKQGNTSYASQSSKLPKDDTSTSPAQKTRIFSFDAPGADLNPGDNNGTYPSGINVWGVIAGSYQSADTVFHGFLRSPGGEFITFQAPGADTTAGSYNGTYPSSINDLGTITGYYWDANGFSHGFLRSPDGNFTTFDVPGVGGYGSTPLAINLEGAIVGYYTDSNYSFHAFLRSPDGKFATWIGPDACTGNGSEGCFGSGASNINAFGTIAGGFEDNSGNFVHRSFVRDAQGNLKVFDVPGAGTGSYQGTGCPGCSLGLNQLGAIAGIYSDANSVNHGFVRSSDGKFTTFDAPGAGTESYQGTGCFSDCPVSINDWGAITGSYIDANYVSHGYLRSSKGNIVTLDPGGSTYTFPDAINDLGSVTGYYLDASGVYHGFLAIPSRLGE